MIGRIFAAACAQLEASVAEQAAAAGEDGAGWRESLAGGNWANVEEATKQTSNEAGKKREVRMLRSLQQN
jgi:hypothetical protein